MGSARNSEGWAVDPVVAEEKVCVIQNVKTFNPELKTKSVGEINIFEKGSVGLPKPRTHKRISAKIAHAAQAGRGEEICGQVETVGPLSMSCIHVTR